MFARRCSPETWPLKLVSDAIKKVERKKRKEQDEEEYVRFLRKFHEVENIAAAKTSHPRTNEVSKKVLEAIKKVQRKKRKEQEEEEYLRFLKKLQEMENVTPAKTSGPGIKEVSGNKAVNDEGFGEIKTKEETRSIHKDNQILRENPSINPERKSVKVSKEVPSHSSYRTGFHTSKVRSNTSSKRRNPSQVPNRIKTGSQNPTKSGTPITSSSSRHNVTIASSQLKLSKTPHAETYEVSEKIENYEKVEGKEEVHINHEENQVIKVRKGEPEGQEEAHVKHEDIQIIREEIFPVSQAESSITSNNISSKLVKAAFESNVGIGNEGSVSVKAPSIDPETESLKVLKEAPSHSSNRADFRVPRNPLNIPSRKKSPSLVSNRIKTGSQDSIKSGTHLSSRSSCRNIIVPSSQFKFMNNRLVALMDSIYFLIGQYREVTNEAMDEEDYLKKRNQAFAFSSRLTRNHLYNLNKQVNEIEKSSLVVALSNEAQINGFKLKLRSAFQCALSATQMCERYLQSGKLYLVTNKILELLKLILQLLKCCEEKVVSSRLCNIIQTTELTLKIESILGLIEFKLNENKLIETQKLSSRLGSNARTVQPKGKPRGASRQVHKLSMYAQNRPQKSLTNRLRRNAAFFPRNFTDSPALNQCRSISFDSLQPKKTMHFSNLSPKSISQKPSDISTASGNTLNKLLKREDLTQTDICSVPSKSCSSQSLIQEAMFARRNNYQEKNRGLFEEEKPSQPRLEKGSSRSIFSEARDLIELIKDKSRSEILLAKGLSQPVSLENIAEEPPTKNCSNEFPPNIKLISIVNDDDSFEITSDSEEEEEFGNKTIDIMQENVDSIIKYKNQNEVYKSQSPLYNAVDYPWESLEQISETLCDDILMQVADNLELDSLIRKIYDLEFR